MSLDPKVKEARSRIATTIMKAGVKELAEDWTVVLAERDALEAKLAEAEDEAKTYRQLWRDLSEREREWRTMHYRVKPRAILYTDSLGGEQVCRDDMWAVTTAELNEAQQAVERLDALRPLVRAAVEGREFALLDSIDALDPDLIAWAKGGRS